MKSKFHKLDKFKPGVSKAWLQLSAGLVWLGVGVMLDIFATRWLKLSNLSTRILLSVAGASLAAAIYTWGFSKLAKKNIRRIGAYTDEKICLFAFQKWSSYPLVAFMMGLGIYLRHYSSLPKSLLAILYLGIGSALFASGLLYFAHIIRSSRPQQSEAKTS